MFTEGLDAEALRWVQEDKHEAISNAQPRTHESQNIKTGDWDFDSDMDDESSDTDEIYAGRHSAESSSSLPHDDISKQRLHNVVSNGHYRYTNSIAQQHYYSSDGYSGYSSSRDTAQQRPLQPRKQVDVNKYAEKEEWSDSGESFGFNGQVGRKVVGNDLPLQGRYAAKVASREDGNSNADKDSMPLRANCTFQDSHSSGNFRDVNSNSEEDKHLNFPSAPPFDVCANEIDHSGVDIPSINACCPPASQDLDGSFIKEDSSKAISENKIPDKHSGSSSCGQKVGKSGSLPTRLPHFYASGQGPWHCVLAYDACVRLCLHSWARGCMEAPSFLENECALLRKAFGLQQILLQSEEELLGQQSSLSCEGIITKPKKFIGKIKFQVHKVRMSPDMPSGCSISALNLPMMNVQSIRGCISSLHSLLAAEWKSLRNLPFLLCLPANSSFSRHSLACVNARTQYAKKVSTRFKVGVSSMQTQTHSSYDMSQETYTCRLKLKSTIEEEAVRMNPGSSESHTFFPDNIGDDLYVEVYDSKGKLCGRVVVQVASISDVSEKTSWWPIYLEPEHLLVGRMQVYLNYTSSSDENNEKCGTIAETVAYDVVMEVAMKAQHFRQRNLALHGSWKWLLTEFAAYFGVSDAYTKLRYLSYVMDVATPTSDCLMLIDDLLFPVITKSNSLNRLSHQENRILGEIKEQIDQVLSLVFENYKSLDESSLSGVLEVFVPPNGNPAPALASSVKLYTLIHDILSPEAQLTLCNAFQAAVKKRSKRHMLDTDEIFANTEGTLVDDVGISTAYQKMKTLCYNVVKEINTDIEIHNHHVLPSFIDLPNISASIYSVELCTRLRSFLKACPPTGLSPPVADLVIATADFQKDLASWNICPVKGGVDAKELFHLYIILWIQDKRLALLEYCKFDKVKWSGSRTQRLTTPFIDEIYDRLKETLNEYEIIMCRWPEYILVLENAIADVEKAMIETLQKQYADVLTPLKNSMAPKSLGRKFMQKLTKGKKVCPYSIPDELGILLNTMKRLLDVLRPKIELQLKSWGSYIPDAGSVVAGERMSEITIIVRSKFRSYLQAVVEKLAENTRAQSATNLKKILQESKGIVAESDVRKRMLPLKNHLTETINHIDKVLEVNVFVSVCRCLWDRLGQDVLKFLENHKENRSLCKASRATVAVLDETFASQMQKLLGNNTLQANDLEPPRSILEVRSILCKDVHKDSSYNYGVRA